MKDSADCKEFGALAFLAAIYLTVWALDHKKARNRVIPFLLAINLVLWVGFFTYMVYAVYSLIQRTIAG